MATDRQRAKAAALRTLQTDGVLVLPNAWDAASAALIAAGGARAIATTSAGAPSTRSPARTPSAT